MAENPNDGSQGDTGTQDIVYNLVSTIYHALQGAETEAMYIADAQQSGDQELIKFFTNLKEENGRRATEAKRLLARHLGQQQGGSQAQGRSAKAIEALRRAGFAGRLLNLKGGITAWSNEVDPSVPKY